MKSKTLKIRIQVSIIVIVLATALNERGFADDKSPAILTLQQARDIAVKNHPRITAAELVALASAQATRATQAGYYPIVTADATAVDATAVNTRITAGGLNNPLILDRNAEGINVSQLITDFGRTANLTASSRLHSQAQEQSALATRAQILLEVDSGYFAALQAQSVLEVAKQTVATRQLTFDQTREYAAHQQKSELDVSFARVDLESSRLLLASTSNDVQASFATLVNLLGERDARTYRLMDEPTNAAAMAAVEDSVQTALRERPDLLQLRFEADSATRFARAEKDLNYPTVSAVGAAGVTPVRDSALRENYAAAGVNLSLPIFDGFLFSAREKEAQLKAKSILENLREAENNVVRDVRLAALNLNLAAQRVVLAAQLLASANEAMQLAQARYKVGLSSMVELSQAQLNQTEAQITQARAKYEYQTRDSILKYTTGQLR